MRYVKWGLIVTFWTVLAAFLHYTLPQRDIVRIVNTYEERQTLDGWTRIFWSEPDPQTASPSDRDVQFIQGVRESGRPIVYRNEDTGWGWPPYFKFDTANLYTEANDAISTRNNPEWFLVTHYGWRNEFLSIFPNAVSITPISSPEDGKPIPWVNIIVLTLLAAFFWAVWVRWRRFRERRIDPALEEMEDRWISSGDAGGERRGWIGRWLGPRRPK